mgnify:CR=1 FL=1
MLITAHGRIVTEYHHREPTATTPGGSYVRSEDVARIVGDSMPPTALDLAIGHISSALGEPVVAVSASTLTMGPGLSPAGAA